MYLSGMGDHFNFYSTKSKQSYCGSCCDNITIKI